MKVLTVNLGDLEFEFLNVLKEEGIFPSRSEAIRFILRLGIPILRNEITFEAKVISKELIPFKNGETDNGNNAFRNGVPLMKENINRFNKSQDLFYLIPDNENPCKYKILKRI
ncbi:MAG: hypothetical protein WBH31_11735 [Promethearchaeia archaeon]